MGRNKLKKGHLLIGVALCLLVGLIVFRDNQTEKMRARITRDYEVSELFIEETLLDRSAFITARDGRVDIAVLGSSVTLGYGYGATEDEPVWGDLLGSYLDGFDNIQTKVINHGYSGYSTSDLIHNGKIDAVIKDRPDIILFELSLINNNRYPQVPVEQTKDEIQSILNRFQEELPDSLVILQTANPTLYNDIVLPKGTLTYDQYNKEIAHFIIENDWPFVDVYERMNQEMQERNREIESILIDNVHPNGEGYAIWYELLKEQSALPLKDY